MNQAHLAGYAKQGAEEGTLASLEGTHDLGLPSVRGCNGAEPLYGEASLSPVYGGKLQSDGTLTAQG